MPDLPIDAEILRVILAGEYVDFTGEPSAYPAGTYFMRIDSAFDLTEAQAARLRELRAGACDEAADA